MFQRDRRDGRRWEILPDRERREVLATARELAALTATAPDASAELRGRLETEVLPWSVDRLVAPSSAATSRAELTAFVREFKEAGLAVSLILMVGMGGKAWQERHREESLATLADLPLDRRDLLYLSPFVEEPGSVYVERRIAGGTDPLVPEEIEAETGIWAAHLRARGLRVGRYDIREFIY